MDGGQDLETIIEAGLLEEIWSSALGVPFNGSMVVSGPQEDQSSIFCYHYQILPFDCLGQVTLMFQRLG